MATRPLDYPMWSPTLGHYHATDPIISLALVYKPRRHYLVTHASGARIAYTDSPSKVVGATEDKPGLTWWAAGLTADYLLDHAEDVAAMTTKEERDHLYTEARRQHDVQKNQAATTGTAVHDFIEQTLRAEFRSQPAPVPPEDTPTVVLDGIAAFHTWWRGQGFHAIEVERTIAHPLHGYAGTMDVVAIDSLGTPVLVDWKTSKSLHASYVRQCGAYSLAYNGQNADDPINHAYIIRLGKEGDDAGKFQAFHLDEPYLRAAEEQFVHSLNLYRFTEETNRRIKDTTPDTSPRF